jgi:hypothetical protein
VLLNQSGVHDNGNSWWNTYWNNQTYSQTWFDANNNENWSRLDYGALDAATGQWGQETARFDDGTKIVTSRDLDGNDSWSRNERYYDAADRLVQETTVGDSGVITQVDRVYEPDGDIVSTVRIDAGTGQDISITDNGVTRSVFVEGQARPLVTLDSSGADDAPVIQALFSERAGAQLLLNPNPATHPALRVVGLGLLLAGFAYDYLVGTAPPTGLNPGSMPDDARFMFGADGTNYYLTKTGQLWQDGPSGLRMTNIVPGQPIATDDVGACTWTFHNESMSAASRAYQEQITGLPVGLNCVANGVRFDGFDYEQNAYLDAKGPRYITPHNHNPDGSPMQWYTGYGQMLDQLERQARAAAGRPVHWYVVDEFAAAIVRNAVASNLETVGRITVIVEPRRP